MAIPGITGNPMSRNTLLANIPQDCSINVETLRVSIPPKNIIISRHRRGKS